MAMHPGPYYLGDSITIDIEIFDAEDLPAEPETLKLRLVHPNGTETSYALNTDDNLTMVEAGSYTCTFPTTMGGRHHYRWEATEPTAIKEGNFVVRKSEFGEDSAY